MSECSDSNRSWYPQRRVCFVRMEIESAQRRYAQLHEDKPFHDGTFTHWSKERSSSTPFHFMDGVKIYAADHDLNPDDDFLQQRR